MDERASLLSHLTRVAAGAAQGPLALRLCLALDQILGMDGSSLAVGYETGTRTIHAATDERAAQVEDLQDVLREGPGLDAHRLGRPVVVEAADLTDRWPLLGQALAQARRLSCLLAVPVRPDDEILGVITMRGPVSSVQSLDLAQVQFLADAIGVAVLGGLEHAEPADSLWSVRDKVNQATGMVVAQLGIPPGDALAVLRAHAFADDASLDAIAAAVLARELVFSSPDDPEKVDPHDDHD
jgi:hypothetical protein